MSPRAEIDARRARVTYAAVVAVAFVVGLGFALHAPDRGAPTASVVAAAAPDPSTTSSVVGPPATSSGAAASATTSTTSAPATTDPGALPQTDDKPTASGATFDAGVHALWTAIATDNPEAGHPSFFPRSAYLQVKSIQDPAGDYQQRLLGNFADDVHTLHAQLGTDASRATFAGVDVPGDQAVWVQPGAEYNKLSYWRVYGTTLRYTVDGQTRTMPVTSLISWRGEWYVVHLGPIR